MAAKNTAKKMIVTFLWDFYFEKIGSSFHKDFLGECVFWSCPGSLGEDRDSSGMLGGSE